MPVIWEYSFVWQVMNRIYAMRWESVSQFLSNKLRKLKPLFSRLCIICSNFPVLSGWYAPSHWSPVDVDPRSTLPLWEINANLDREYLWDPDAAVVRSHHIDGKPNLFIATLTIVRCPCLAARRLASRFIVAYTSILRKHTTETTKGKNWCLCWRQESKYLCFLYFL